MIHFHNPDAHYHYNSVLQFAEFIGKKEDLLERLDYLANYACHDNPNKTQCVLVKDFSPNSFYFNMRRLDEDNVYQFWFNGGLIFDESDKSWGIHT